MELINNLNAEIAPLAKYDEPGSKRRRPLSQTMHCTAYIENSEFMRVR